MVVEALAQADSELAARVVARAFRDNPLNRAVIGSPAAKRLRSNLHGSRVAFRAPMTEPLPLRLAARSCEAEAPEAPGELAGLLLGLAPDGYPAPQAPLGAQLRSLWGQGWRVSNRWGEVFQALFEVHPREPHWYLDVLAVIPEKQRRGVGGALLAAFLARVDADRAASYLETDREENLAFYAAAGYEVVREVCVLGTNVWCMWRDAPGV